MERQTERRERQGEREGGTDAEGKRDRQTEWMWMNIRENQVDICFQTIQWK